MVENTCKGKNSLVIIIIVFLDNYTSKGLTGKKNTHLTPTGFFKCYAISRKEEYIKEYTVLIFLECTVGSWGDNCTNVCPYPFFGDGCTNICGCNQTMCNKEKGCLNLGKNFNFVFLENSYHYLPQFLSLLSNELYL